MSKNWGNGRPQKSDKEFSRVQKITHENNKLKEEIARYRKTIARIESGWCQECLKKYDNSDPDLELPEPIIENPPETGRTCYKCQDGKLSIVKYFKISEQWYYRKCNKCPNRTRGKRLTSDVKE